ncbi:hypothetical protein [Castellaniella sp.]|uniref:hypothetical protein n=1 Tax=Castellaniella sp. TaxID=1955812 RepID=UPI003A958C7D
MMAQNILAGLDDWLGADCDLKKPDVGSVAAIPQAAANEPVSHPPAVAVTAPDTMTFHDLAERPQGLVRTEVRTEKAVSTESAPAQAIEVRPLADAYYRHHWKCLHCIAAGQNPNLTRCAVGTPLWDAYRAASIQSREAQNHD